MMYDPIFFCIQSPPAGAASSFQSSSYENYQLSSTGAAADSYGLAASSAGGVSTIDNAGLDLVGGAGGASSSSYESSSSYSTGGNLGGYTGGFESSIGNLGLAGNLNNVGSSSSYESYSSEQTYNQ